MDHLNLTPVLDEIPGVLPRLDLAEELLEGFAIAAADQDFFGGHNAMAAMLRDFPISDPANMSRIYAWNMRDYREKNL